MTPSAPGPFRYHAFISYSHAADGKLAPALQTGLQRFAKPWYRLRALRVFRDKTGLAVTPELWSSIRRALETSEYFVLLASPTAAESRWVHQEVDFWLQQRSIETLLIVLTDGDIVWNVTQADFDWSRTTALPRLLERRFSSEPHFLDLRWARADTDLSLRRPRFLDAVASLAATLRHVSLDDLLGEDVAHHRTTRRLLRAGVVALVMLTVSALYAAYLANEARRLAQRLDADRIRAVAAEQQVAAEHARQRDARVQAEAEQARRVSASRELAATATRVFATDRELSLLLALEAAEMAPTPEAEEALRRPLTRPVPPVVLRGPEDLAVSNATFSPDGGRILALFDDGSVRIWTAVGATEPVVLTRESVRSPGDDRATAAFSPDGTRVVTASYRSLRTFLGPEGATAAARIWDAGSGRLRHELRHPYVHHAAFSPDGKRVVTVSDDRTVVLWDAETGARQAALTDHENGVVLAAFSKDGRWLLTADKFGEVRIRTAADGQTATLLRAPGGLLFGASFSPDGRWVLTLSKDRTLRLWDWRSAPGASAADIRAASGPIYDASFSPDSRLLVTAGGEERDGLPVGTARVWDVATGRGLRELTGHPGAIYAASFSPDGRWVVTAGGDVDGRAVVWDPSTGKPLVELGRSAAVRTTAVFSPDGSRIASGTADGRLFLDRCEVCGSVRELVGLGRSRGRRTLTEAERAEYVAPLATR